MDCEELSFLHPEVIQRWMRDQEHILEYVTDLVQSRAQLETSYCRKLTSWQQKGIQRLDGLEKSLGATWPAGLYTGLRRYLDVVPHMTDQHDSILGDFACFGGSEGLSNLDQRVKQCLHGDPGTGRGLKALLADYTHQINTEDDLCARVHVARKKHKKAMDKLSVLEEKQGSEPGSPRRSAQRGSSATSKIGASLEAASSDVILTRSKLEAHQDKEAATRDMFIKLVNKQMKGTRRRMTSQVGRILNLVEDLVQSNLAYVTDSVSSEKMGKQLRSSLKQLESIQPGDVTMRWFSHNEEPYPFPTEASPIKNKRSENRHRRCSDSESDSEEDDVLHNQFVKQQERDVGAQMASYVKKTFQKRPKAAVKHRRKPQSLSEEVMKQFCRAFTSPKKDGTASARQSKDVTFHMKRREGSHEPTTSRDMPKPTEQDQVYHMNRLEASLCEAGCNSGRVSVDSLDDTSRQEKSQDSSAHDSYSSSAEDHDSCHTYNKPTHAKPKHKVAFAEEPPRSQTRRFQSCETITKPVDKYRSRGTEASESNVFRKPTKVIRVTESDDADDIIACHIDESNRSEVVLLNRPKSGAKQAWSWDITPSRKQNSPRRTKASPRCHYDEITDITPFDDDDFD